MAAPKYVAPETGRKLNVLGETVVVILRSEDTDGTHGVITEDSTPGGGPPLHVHTREDEFFYVISGEYEFQVGDKTFRAPAGSHVFAPRNIPHRFRNVSGGPARLTVTLAPAGFEHFFEEIHVLCEKGPPAIDRVVELGARYGLTFLL